MAEFKHGEMDTQSQEATFNGFLKIMTRGAIVVIVSLILIALING